MQHGNGAGNLSDEDHVVLDDDDAVLPGKAHEELAGLGGLLVGHAGGGFVHEEKLWVLREQHSDFEPLLLAVRQRPGFPRRPVGQADGLEHFMDALALGRGHAREDRAPDAAAPLKREQDVLEDRVVDVNRGRLELPTDAETVDLVFVKLSQVRVRTELDLSFVRPGASGDDVEHRAFARAIRADDDAELTFIHVEVEVVDRLEAVEGFADAFERENELFVRRHGIFGLTGCATGPVSAAGLPKSFFLSSRNCSGRPMIPFGMKSVTKTKSAPRM